jgi:hypothetical protein
VQARAHQTLPPPTDFGKRRSPSRENVLVQSFAAGARPPSIEGGPRAGRTLREISAPCSGLHNCGASYGRRENCRGSNSTYGVEPERAQHELFIRTSRCLRCFGGDAKRPTVSPEEAAAPIMKVAAGQCLSESDCPGRRADREASAQYPEPLRPLRGPELARSRRAGRGTELWAATHLAQGFTITGRRFRFPRAATKINSSR